MGHRVHPKAYRIRGIADWDSRGFYRKPAKLLEEDFKIREFLKKILSKVGVEKIEIERFSNKLNIIISSARPGLIIGRGGEGIEKLRKELEQKILEKRTEKKPASAKATAGKEELRIEVREIRDPWTSAGLSAQWVAQQIEKRVAYRRVLKRALSKITSHKEIQGARIQLSGRLNGAEIARREWLGSGKLPRQTIRADIDYAKAEAHCNYGVIGVKVWIYKGEKF
ncbi:30S ribosomal protein S3 [Patescibacteria group bacterium]|nr:30S ribosomal protein S3 [Patescibacteria group bacterium]